MKEFTYESEGFFIEVDYELVDDSFDAHAATGNSVVVKRQTIAISDIRVLGNNAADRTAHYCEHVQSLSALEKDAEERIAQMLYAE